MKFTTGGQFPRLSVRETAVIELKWGVSESFTTKLSSWSLIDHENRILWAEVDSWNKAIIYEDIAGHPTVSGCDRDIHIKYSNWEEAIADISKFFEENTHIIVTGP